MPRPEGPMINERCLRIRELRIVGTDGAQLGVMSSREALGLSKEAGLDLVLVAATAQPPVARIIDYGKYKYEQEKLKKSNKKKTLDVKSIKFRPGTSEHDLGHNIKHAQKFLADGHKVKVICQFRAREIVHPEIGKQKLKYFANKLEEFCVIEKEPNMEGRLMTMMLAPQSQKSASIHSTNGQDQNSPNKGDTNAKDKNTQDSSEKI